MGWLELLRSIVEMAYKPSEKAGDLLWEFFSWVHSEVSQARGVEGELRKVRDTKERICCLLRDVETRRSVTEERVLRWLGDLRDVALDAEDLLEEFTTRQALSGRPATARKRKRSWRAPHIFLRRRVAKEIAEIRNRYDAITEDRTKLGLRESEAPRRGLTEAPSTGAIIRDGLHILGRDGDRERIVDLLLLQQPAGLHVVPIYGMAGQGKTALANYIFNDAGRVAQFFKKRIWVCATRGFDVERITKEILQSLTGRACHLSNFNVLQQHARKLLAREPVLLVLDDVRGDGPLHWEHLQVCLQEGDGRSRVLITTRSEEVASKMGTLQQGRLNGLSDDDCFALFKQRVSPDEAFMERRPVLRDIGWQIVRKCQGSPLAAISLGGLLSGKTDETEWSSTVEEAAAFSEDGGLDILRVLHHAYELLPAHLKKCFAFCAVFPPGHQFDRDELVRMWMAQGFVDHRGNRRLEDIGGRFFDELLWMSFFQQAPDRDQNPQCCSKYEVPRLLHEVSQSVSKHECFRMAGDDPRPHDVPERARHLALYRRNGGGPTTFPGFREHKRLRTLALQAETRTGIEEQLPSALFPKLTHLRVLDLGNTGISELPDSIGELLLLRYLSLYNCPIERLPESVADLYNLQTLELGECYDLVELPEGTSNLTNLRHLGLHLDQQRGVSKLTSVPPGIGKLTSLQTLSRFAVGTRSGCGISEMKNLNPRGELWISRLENVSSLEEAREANLKDKWKLHTLTLQWTCSESSDVPDLQHEAGRVDVIECLQPPTQIKHLHVDGYDGATVPVWMGGGGGGGGTPFSELVTLRLSNCKRWESLPSLGELPVLKELYIEGMHNIRSMAPMFSGSGQRFPCLEKIHLRDLPRLERWDVAEGDMPRLSELQIGQCARLTSLPCAPSSHVKVIIEDCEASTSFGDHLFKGADNTQLHGECSRASSGHEER